MTTLTTARSRRRTFTPKAPRTQLLGLVCVGAGALLVLYIMKGDREHDAQRLLEVVVAAGAALAISRRPHVWVCVMIAVLPIQQLLLAFAFGHGAPLWAIRGAGAFKETLVVAVVIAAVRHTQRVGGIPFDALDRWLTAFVLLAVAYIFLPRLPLPLKALSFSTELLGARQTALWALLLLALRRLPASERDEQRLLRTVLGVAIVVALCAIVETISPSTWNKLVINICHFPHYKFQVLHEPLSDPTDVTNRSSFAGSSIVRAGSVFVSPLALGFWMSMPAVLAAQRATGAKVRGSTGIVAALLGAGLLLSETRSAILGVLIGIAVVMLRQRDKVRATMLLILGALVLIPVALSTTLEKRTFGGGGGVSNGADTQQHLTQTITGLRDAFQHPLGSGLGTGAGIGARFGQDLVVAENSYVGTANELGIAAAVIFIAIIVQLVRTAAKESDSDLARGALGGVLAFAITALFLEPTVEVVTMLLIGSVCGVALRHDRPRNRGTPIDAGAIDP